MTQLPNEQQQDEFGQSGGSGSSAGSHANDSIFANAGNSETAVEDGSNMNSISQLEQLIVDLRDRELKAQAELENFRRRILRDVDTQLKFAAMPLVNDLLEVVDNLHRASGTASGATSIEGVVAGVKLVQQQLGQVLAKHHCEPIPGVGHPFDPNVHQAIAQQPSSEFPAGTVMLETSLGFRMYDRVVRPSMVIVSTGPAA